MTLKRIVCVLVAFGGMILVSGVAENTEKGISEFKGIFLGLGAAVLYSCVVLLNKKLHDISAYDKTIVQLGSAALTILPYTLFFENEQGGSAGKLTLIMMLIVGILHTGIAYAFYFGSMDGLPTHTVALFSYIDPVVAIILSALFLKEKIGWTGVIGAVLVLGATFISEFDFKKTEHREEASC